MRLKGKAKIDFQDYFHSLNICQVEQFKENK